MGKVDFGICHFALRWAPPNKLQSWNHQTVNHLSVMTANQSLCDWSFSHFSTRFALLTSVTSHFWPTASVSAQTIIKHCGTRGQRSCFSQCATTNDMRACVHFLQTATLHYESFSTWFYKCKSSLISRTLKPPSFLSLSGPDGIVRAHWHLSTQWHGLWCPRGPIEQRSRQILSIELRMRRGTTPDWPVCLEKMHK